MKALLWIALSLPLIPCALSWSARPEKPLMSQEGLQKTATHVVVGTVDRVYTFKEKKSGYHYTHSLAELTLESQEKGEKLDLKSPMYVRYFHRQDTKQRVGGSGHYGYAPKAGDRVRAFVARNAYDGWHQAKDNQDGGFNVIPPNGFEKLPAKKAAPKKAKAPR